MGFGAYGLKGYKVYGRWDMRDEALGRWNDGEWYEERPLGEGFGSMRHVLGFTA